MAHVTLLDHSAPPWFVRRRNCALTVALLVLSRLCAAADTIAPLTVSEVAPGVFVHAGTTALMTHDNEGAIANVGFVIGADAVAVIDTGGSVREGLRLLAAIRAATAKPIRYVVNTHAHPDHVFGNAAFVGTGARFVGHRNLPAALSARGSFYLDNFRRLMGDDLIAEVGIVPPSVLVDGTVSLDLGGRVLELHGFAAAHTDSDVVVFDRQTATLFAGDLVFVRHVPVLDASLKGWLAALDALAAIPARRVIPGHGPVSEWPAALAPLRGYLTRLQADVRELIRQGVPLDRAVAEAGTSEKSRWDLFEEYNRRNATAAYAEAEWE